MKETLVALTKSLYWPNLL